MNRQRIKQFISVNAIIIGTILMGTGFLLLINAAIFDLSQNMSLISFFVILAGLPFWYVGYYMKNPLKISKPVINMRISH